MSSSEDSTIYDPLSPIDILLYRGLISVLDDEKIETITDLLNWETKDKVEYLFGPKPVEKLRWYLKSKQIKGDLNSLIRERLAETLSAQIKQEITRNLINEVSKKVALYEKYAPKETITSKQSQVEISRTLTSKIYFDFVLNPAEVAPDKKARYLVDITMSMVAPDIVVEHRERQLESLTIGSLDVKLLLSMEKMEESKKQDPKKMKIGDFPSITINVSLPWKIRNEELLIILADNQELAGSVATEMAVSFDRLPENVRNSVLIKLADNEATFWTIAGVVRSKFDRLPENVRNTVLTKLANKGNTTTITSILGKTNFDKLPENLRDKLLIGKRKGLL